MIHGADAPSRPGCLRLSPPGQGPLLCVARVAGGLRLCTAPGLKEAPILGFCEIQGEAVSDRERFQVLPEFRKAAVRLTRDSDRQTSAVAHDLGVHPDSLRTEMP